MFEHEINLSQNLDPRSILVKFLENRINITDQGNAYDYDPELHKLVVTSTKARAPKGRKRLTVTARRENHRAVQIADQVYNLRKLHSKPQLTMVDKNDKNKCG